MAQRPTKAAIEPGAARRIGSLKLVFRYLLRYPRQLVYAAAALLLAALATLAIPRQLQQMVDRGFGSRTGDIAPYFHYMFMIVGVLAIATAARFYFVSWLGERVVADLRRDVHANLLDQAPRFFEENRPGEIASRMTADTSVIEQVVGTTVSIALRNIVVGIGGIVYLFVLAPGLAGMLLLGIPLIIVPIVLIGRRVQVISRSSQDRIADVGAMVAETLGAMKIVQAFGQESRERGRFGQAVEASFDTARRRIKWRAALTLVVITMIFGAITGVMWEGASDVVAGRLTGGTITAFIFAGVLTAGSFGALTEVWGDILRGAGAAGRLGELLQASPDIARGPKSVAMPAPRGSLAFDHVTFRYPTRPDDRALDDFTLTVEPGETVAVVGPSGAGKSTLFQLALRFYDPQRGAVRIDGVPLANADPAELRLRIAYVPQETVLFAASARDNLRYGRWDADDEQLWEAARLANAESFLRALPQGLDTYLGEGGARLSGGQRQRIAIARAMLRTAPILLLDEATSALDAESERLVQDALDRLMADRTTIVIAHRLATVRSADRIVVMDEGRIVEEGSHGQLEGAGGLYERLAKLQFEGA
ncbi:ABC transporter transmembrane domain-containing protein [Novosphingopyxis sp.]|uniref:ABC transporter transmembrane domain-containing protein n=1 Tax=Novosphingopyxis sp. TaxID=2709690 RepID=UPI003B59C311